MVSLGVLVTILALMLLVLALARRTLLALTPSSAGGPEACLSLGITAWIQRPAHIRAKHHRRVPKFTSAVLDVTGRPPDLPVESHAASERSPRRTQSKDKR